MCTHVCNEALFVNCWNYDQIKLRFLAPPSFIFNHIYNILIYIFSINIIKCLFLYYFLAWKHLFSIINLNPAHSTTLPNLRSDICMWRTDRNQTCSWLWDQMELRQDWRSMAIRRAPTTRPYSIRELRKRETRRRRTLSTDRQGQFLIIDNANMYKEEGERQTSVIQIISVGSQLTSFVIYIIIITVIG